MFSDAETTVLTDYRQSMRLMCNLRDTPCKTSASRESVSSINGQVSVFVQVDLQNPHTFSSILSMLHAPILL